MRRFVCVPRHVHLYTDVQARTGWGSRAAEGRIRTHTNACYSAGGYCGVGAAFDVECLKTRAPDTGSAPVGRSCPYRC